MRWPFARAREDRSEDIEQLRLQAERARALVEESREMVLVLDADDRVIAASREARRGLDGVAEGRPVPAELLSGAGRHG
jgi:PAS domain-containing protein